MYELADCTTVGVPEISPVDVEKVRPAGSAGVIAQEVTVPPFADGDAGVIADPFSRVNGLPEYETECGERSLTWIVTVAVPLPPAFVAVMM